MAVGLIKKQIVHTGSPNTVGSPIKQLFASKKSKAALGTAQTAYGKEMKAFKGQEYTNPYAQAKNLITNVYEDLTVNQQQAQFEKQMFQEQQAGMMQQMGGAAGGSGIAGLAQAMLGQGQRQAQRIGASIGQQEQATQMAAARGQADVQRAGMQVQQMQMGGEAALQKMEMDRQATMLGMAQAQVAGAQQAIAGEQAMWGSIIGGVASVAGGLMTGGATAV